MKYSLKSKSLVGPVRGLSLQHRIPLWIALLLFGGISSFIIISYLSVRKIEWSGTKQRISALATQVSVLFAESIEDFVTTTRVAATAHDLGGYLLDPDPVRMKEVAAVLETNAGYKLHEYAILLDHNFKPLMVAGKPQLALTQMQQTSLPLVTNGNLNACNIYQVNDTIYYAAVAPINIDNQTLGYLVRCQQVDVDSRVLERYAALAGEGILMLVGNRDGSLWTNLAHPVDYVLPGNAGAAGKMYRYESDAEEDRVGAYQNIQGTPWMVVVEVPVSLALQASSSYLKWITGIAALFVLVAIMLAWYLGRNLTIPLKELIASTKALGSGDYREPVPVHRTDEVGALALSFNDMILQLHAAKELTRQQITASEKLNEELRRLSSHLNNVREHERMSIARELHDQLGQVLTALKMDLYGIKKELTTVENKTIHQKIKSLDESLGEGVRFVRKLASELRVGPLEDLGLVAALEWYANTFSERYSIAVTIRTTSQDIDLSIAISTAIFRIFQEALTNVARHAQATDVQVKMRKEAGELKMRITDNGRGFDSRCTDQPKTLGLLGMKERALMIASELTIFSRPGRGCTVELSISLPEATKVTNTVVEN